MTPIHIHVGANGSQDTDYLIWAVTEARQTIDPLFIVATGDLTDSTNGVSMVPAPKGLWPLVMITAPADRCFGECPNSYAYEIPQSRSNPIRALIFDNNPVSQVHFRIDETGDWHTMQQMENTSVWFGLWDARLFAPGSHTIEVRAQGSSVVIDRVTT